MFAMMVMRLRKANAIIGAGILVGAMFVIYLVLDTISIGGMNEETQLQKVREKGHYGKVKSDKGMNI